MCVSTFYDLCNNIINNNYPLVTFHYKYIQNNGGGTTTYSITVLYYKPRHAIKP